MQIAPVPYKDEETLLEGFVAYSSREKRPAVILCHSWGGRDDFICEKAKAIAHWGYVGFALDMYGKGVLGKSREECAALKKPFLHDRQLLQKRVFKAFEAVKALPYVDSQKIAVLGFGFGGICALDLARSGAHLQGAISVYGHFAPPPTSFSKPIQAKILILHGYKDPLSPQSDLLIFEKEMNDAKIDWQAHIYGNALHAFATPSANDSQSGILYDELSSKRAWTAIEQFLKEIFFD